MQNKTLKFILIGVLIGIILCYAYKKMFPCGCEEQHENENNQTEQP